MNVLTEILKDHPEWEVTIRCSTNECLAITLYGPHRKNPNPKESHKTRPYIGCLLKQDNTYEELIRAITKLKHDMVFASQ